MNERQIESSEAMLEKRKNEAIEQIRARLPTQPLDFDGLCVDCGDDIPPLRIKFGASNCVMCQEIAEKKARHSHAQIRDD